MRPEWLPPLLPLAGSSLQDNLEQLHAIYTRDFIDSALPIVDRRMVLVNNRPDPTWNSIYTYGFTHIITRGEGHRAIDFDRAQRLPWVRAILDNYMEPEVTAFWVQRRKGERLYLWLRDQDFIVILTPLLGKNTSSSSDAIIVTAFCIDPYRRREFERLLDAAKIIL